MQDIPGARGAAVDLRRFDHVSGQSGLLCSIPGGLADSIRQKNLTACLLSYRQFVPVKKAGVMAAIQEPDQVNIPSYPGTPRWVRVLGVIAGVLFLLILYSVAIDGGGHGPSRHASMGSGSGHAGSGRPVLLGALFLTTVTLNWGWLADRGLLPSRFGRFSEIRLWPWQTMTPRLRKFVLTAHVTTSVGWLGAVLAYLALDVTATTSRDVPTVRAAYVGMDLTIWYAIVPLALASVLIGIINALGTPWGLFRHYWVLLKFLLTILATIVLLQEAQVVSILANTATSSADPRELPGTLLHSGGGLLALLGIAVLAIFKPRGVTRYGWRKQHERADARS